MAFATRGPQQDSDTIIARVPDVVRWTAVIAGVVIGLGIFAMLNALWWLSNMSPVTAGSAATWRGCWTGRQRSLCYSWD